MSNQRYAYWREAVRDPENVSPQSAEGDIDGWYRITTKAKSKHMYPVVIWHDDEDVAWVKVGQSAPKLLDGPEGDDFRAGSWNWCVAVETGQYEQAFKTGTWWDGRAARKPPAAQYAPTMEDSGGPEAPPSEGPPLSNNPPDLEVWADELEALKDAADNASIPTTADAASTLDGLYQRLRKFWGKVDEQRKVEKKPHDEAAAKVQSTYKPLLDPAEVAGKRVKGLLDDWLRAEEKRMRAEEAERQRKEQEEREAAGMDEPPEPVRKGKPESAKTYSTEGGRATSLRTTYVGVIENETKFINAIKKSSDFQEWLQNKANALARAKTTVAGMKIEERR